MPARFTVLKKCASGGKILDLGCVILTARQKYFGYRTSEIRKSGVDLKVFVIDR